jgi:mono/diheme cytochrome c family protein
MLRIILGTALLVSTSALLGCGSDSEPSEPAPSFQSADIKRGGRLYDEWWAVPGVKDPTEPGTNPGYAKTTGTQTGSVTWRCKECHGWDYRGKDGAYAMGSHATGAPGLLGVPQSDEPDELFGAIKNGKANTAMSAFGSHLSDRDIWDLVKFIKDGMIDISSLINASTKKPVSANASQGAPLFAGTCALTSCHGADGKAVNFGTAAEPEFVGTVAADNPWEFFHKVRAGQPGTDMPSALTDTRWSVQQIMDVLAHAQTLPTQ